MYKRGTYACMLMVDIRVTDLGSYSEGRADFPERRWRKNGAPRVGWRIKRASIQQSPSSGFGSDMHACTQQSYQFCPVPGMHRLPGSPYSRDAFSMMFGHRSPSATSRDYHMVVTALSHSREIPPLLSPLYRHDPESS